MGRSFDMQQKLQPLLNPSRKVRIVSEIVCFVFCFLCTMSQLGILDYYFIHYTGENLWYCWIAGDVLVATFMIWLLVNAIQYNERCSKKECVSDANLKFAFIAWFVYSAVLSGKIATTVFVYADKVDKREFFGPAVYRIVLSLSAIVFLLLVMSHHYTHLNSPRQTYLSYLASSVTLDILDSILFLELLYMPKLRSLITNGSALQIAILVFTCVNFVLPTFALLKLRFKHGLPKWCCLPYEKVYTLLYFLIVNVPYLVIRFHIWRNAPEDYVDPGANDGATSIFIVKNFIMVFIGARELWISYLLAKEVRQGGNAATHGGKHVEQMHLEEYNGNGAASERQQATAPSIYPSMKEA